MYFYKHYKSELLFKLSETSVFLMKDNKGTKKMSRNMETRFHFLSNDQLKMQS